MAVNNFGVVKPGRTIYLPFNTFDSNDPSASVTLTGLAVGDILATNGKFGLTGVGFDILLNRGEDVDDFPKYRRSIMSVLEPKISGVEALLLSDRQLATSSIDSSDGFSKLLLDLMKSNPNLGFEIDFDENLFEFEARMYSQEFNIPLEDLVFNAGEEYIHFFTIPAKYRKVRYR